MATERDKDRIRAIRERIKGFPTGPGLYLMKGTGDVVLYIGKARNLRSRVAGYFQPGSDLHTSRGPKIVEMVNKVRTVDYIETKNDVDAILQEARLIKDIRPPYNTNLVDDKTFPYLEITTRRDFPGVYITRKPQGTQNHLFGPFTAVGDLRAVLVVLQRIFKFRTCRQDIRADDDRRRFFRPCLLYSIKQCTAPCAAKIEKEAYKAIIKDMIRFMQSKRSVVLRRLRKRMETAAAGLEYETAAMYRDRIRLIERLDERGTVDGNVQPEVFAADPSAAMEKLRKLLKADEPIRVIEGFDIAHISGAETVGAMVQFIDGKPFRSGYRRFKIKTVTGVDDYASIREVVRRRYKRAAKGEELWPDVVLIDGGIGQLHAAEEAFAMMKVTPESLPWMISIAKKEELIYLHGSDEPMRLSAKSPVRKLLQYVRDEAHRFAQHYHHILRSKKMLGKG